MRSCGHLQLNNNCWECTCDSLRAELISLRETNVALGSENENMKRRITDEEASITESKVANPLLVALNAKLSASEQENAKLKFELSPASQSWLYREARLKDLLREAREVLDRAYTDDIDSDEFEAFKMKINAALGEKE